MSSIYLPPEILDQIAEEVRWKRDLCSFSLVSRAWRWPARKRIRKELTINGYSVTSVLELVNWDKELRKYVKKLFLVRSERRRGGKLPLIALRQVEKLLNILLHLSSIDIPDAALNLSTGIIFQLTVDLLSNLTSFTFGGSLEFDLVRKVLGRAIRYFRSFPSLLPPVSLLKLKKLVYCDDELIKSSGLLNLIQQNNSSPEQLTLITSDEQFLFGDLMSVIFSFPNLTTLVCPPFINVPVNFFSLLPSILKIIDIAVSTKHLEYLQLHPRPNFKFSQITLSSYDGAGEEEYGERHQLLPNHVETIKYHLMTGLQLEGILLSWKKSEKPEKLKCINVSYLSRKEMASRGADYLISVFKKLGIELQIIEHCDQ